MKNMRLSLALLLLLGATSCMTKVKSDQESTTTATQKETNPTATVPDEQATANTKGNEMDLRPSESKQQVLSLPKMTVTNATNAVEKQETVTNTSTETQATVKSVSEEIAPFLPWDKTEIAGFFEENIKASEFLRVTPSADKSVSITAKEGTIFTLPPSALIDEEGKVVTSPITLEVKECYKMKDILLSNLSTQSGDMPIETDGMVYVQAKSGNKKLKLAPNKALIVELPTKEKKDRMELFYGRKSNMTGVMDWKVADTRPRTPAVTSNALIPSLTELPNSMKQFDLGTVEIQFGAKTNERDNRKVFAKISEMNPKLSRYEKALSEQMNIFVSESNWKSYRNFRAAHPEYKYFPISLPFCVPISDLDAAFTDLDKYKNFAFKRKMSFIAVMRKDLYYKTVDLMGSRVFDPKRWKEDLAMFSKNFNMLKETGFDVFAAADAWRESADQLMSEHQAQYAASYLFASNEMGWLNCDRFMPCMDMCSNITVKCDNTQNVEIKLIYLDQKTVFSGTKTKNQTTFMNVSEGKRAKIFAVRKRGKHTEFAIREIVTGQNKVISDLQFEEMSFVQLENAFVNR